LSSDTLSVRMSDTPAIARWIPPRLLAGARCLLDRYALDRYHSRGRVQWTRGYNVHKWRLIESLIKSPEVLAAFRDGAPLPERYGVGVDERCVEYPWLLSRLSGGTGPLLDAGSTLNHGQILAAPAFRDRPLHILTLAPEKSAYWWRGISYLYADLRDIPMRNALYDEIACISTLEHVGIESSDQHGARPRERPDYDFLRALDELWRVLKPGGNLFITVPFGIYRDHVTFQQFDQALLNRVIDRLGLYTDTRVFVYRYLPGGWQLARPDECSECRYVEWVARMWATGEHTPDQEPSDGAAAARAVACLHIIKQKN
jgi:SAM-dependent methyltransferase